MAYHVNLFTVETWQEFKNAGGVVTGFRESMWPRVRNVRPGDRLVCYLVGAARWLAVLEATGDPYLDLKGERIWAQDQFPARVPVTVVMEVEPEEGPLVEPMLDDLEAAKDLKNRKKWGTLFLGSPRGWPEPDGQRVERALAAARESPVKRALPASAFRLQTTEVVDAEGGVVTVPAEDEPEAAGIVRSETSHTEMQAILTEIGAAMGYQVYIAQGDRSREWNGRALADRPGVTTELALPFTEAALRVIRHIDVLWLDGDAIQAAWEIERTTSIYSGLLRMTDLFALQPNISMPMFLVAPESRSEKVAEQLHRPTFARMRPHPLAEMCQFVSFESLREAATKGMDEWRYLRFQYVADRLAEWLEPYGV